MYGDNGWAASATDANRTAPRPCFLRRRGVAAFHLTRTVGRHEQHISGRPEIHTLHERQPLRGAVNRSRRRITVYLSKLYGVARGNAPRYPKTRNDGSVVPRGRRTPKETSAKSASAFAVFGVRRVACKDEQTLIFVDLLRRARLLDLAVHNQHVTRNCCRSVNHVGRTRIYMITRSNNMTDVAAGPRARLRTVRRRRAFIKTKEFRSSPIPRNGLLDPIFRIYSEVRETFEKHAHFVNQHPRLIWTARYKRLFIFFFPNAWQVWSIWKNWRTE